jgi:hypothetical protein
LSVVHKVPQLKKMLTKPFFALRLSLYILINATSGGIEKKNFHYINQNSVNCLPLWGKLEDSRKSHFCAFFHAYSLKGRPQQVHFYSGG